jgi:hypothetical protein
MAKIRWDAEADGLIKRFRALTPMSGEFELRSGVTVIDPVKFHQCLESEIAGGPGGARARTKALITDLKDYLAMKEGRSPSETKSPRGEAT